MSEIFSRNGSEFKGSFSADGARLAFAGDAAGAQILGVGLLTQSINMGYQQTIQQLYEIGTRFTYYIAGRAQGQLSLGRILGPRPVQIAFYTKYGNVCNAATNNLNFEADTGCSGDSGPTSAENGTFTFGLRAVVITSISISIASAQDMMISEQVAMKFAAMDLGKS